MNSTSLLAPARPGLPARPLSAVPARASLGAPARAAFPVLGNRAFIRAWAARRAKAGPAVVAAQRLVG